MTSPPSILRDVFEEDAARSLVEKIARDHTLEGAIFGTAFESLVSNCLEIISNQLYGKSTHFLLELIQNADDNLYTAPIPTLNLSYKPGFLRVDCNEVGFTPKDVEAVCAVNQSTKGGKATDSEYIGEKGIGFKSVFKAADVIWISSRGFTFKFDKMRSLGMVTPVWAEFPEPTQTGWTSFYLQLSKTYGEEILLDELLAFDANLLIFLRRVNKINIRVADNGKFYNERRIWKERSQHHVTVLHAGEDAYSYLVRSHTVEDLPEEQKRPNRKRTKILLGFPLAEAFVEPRPVPQNVYAFLPIRNYGLKFLVHGDFLLTASREDIESTLPWNCGIRDAVAEAFLSCVHHFNEEDLRYLWPWYLPCLPTTNVSFFDPAIESILEHLGALPVLECWTGTLEKASSLKYVPMEFRTSEGEPFTLSLHTAREYLSSRYPTWTFDGARSIGVLQFTPEDFLRDLESMTDHDPHDFQTRSDAWHSQLAEVLVKLAIRADFLSRMQKLCLIPLVDGTWISTIGHTILFSGGDSSSAIPSGMDVLMVNPSTESDVIRRNLFIALGVKAWNAPEVCRSILRLHQSTNFDPATLITEQLITHAAFLYKASWNLPKDTDIWFVTTQGEWCKGRELYIAGGFDSDSPASRVFAQLQKHFHVIHNDYFKLHPMDEHWAFWLVSSLGLSMIPRLVAPVIQPTPPPVCMDVNNSEYAGLDLLSSMTFTPVAVESDHEEDLAEDELLAQYTSAKKLFTVSDEFVLLFEECNSSDVFQILQDNWSYYAQWIGGAHLKWQGTRFTLASIHLKRRLGNFLVQSIKGTLPLEESVLPGIDSQVDERNLAPAVRIRSSYTDWTFLKYFGVVTQAGVRYYLRCLISMSKDHHADIDDVGYIYEKIQSLYKEDAELVRTTFYERDIVLTYAHPSRQSQSSVWMNMRDCVTNDLAVETQYPGSSYLFRCLESTDGDPIVSIVATATRINTSSTLKDISGLFSRISTALKNVSTSQAADLLRPLRYLSIFPVSKGLGHRPFDQLLSLRDWSWYIADRPLLRKSFHGIVPLLALSLEDLAKSKAMFKILRMDDRYVSMFVKSRAQPVGQISLNPALSASFQKKSPLINALVPESHSKRGVITRQIENIKVSLAAHISQILTLRDGETNVQGSPVTGQCSLDSTGNFLHLIMTEDAATAALLPYEVITVLAEECQIRDPNHRWLLFTALINPDVESLHSAFSDHGIHISGLVFDQPKDRYQAQRGDMMQIPSPFWESSQKNQNHVSGDADVLLFDRLKSGPRELASAEDRRLPMQDLLSMESPALVDYQPISERLNGWRNTQHLGEHMVSKIFDAYLGDAYIPERDWTSDLRSRSGYQVTQSSAPCAAFTLLDAKVATEMTTFLAKFGRSQAHRWKETLQRNRPVYHVDVLVSTGNKGEPFAIESTQIERMRRFTMDRPEREPNVNVSVLVKISDIYSPEPLSLDLVVDPWRLFQSNELRLEEGWTLRGTLHEDTLGPFRKRRKIDAPVIQWDTRAMLNASQTHSISLQDRPSNGFYTYQTLKPGEFRLIHLAPGKTSDQLQGVIVHFPSISAPPYQALSYVWGTTVQTRDLITPDGILPITLSLEKALRRIRSREQPMTLWIDAICIQQMDPKEKEKQVRMLSKIFQNATSTYAFIDGGENTGAALQTLMQVRLKTIFRERQDHREKMGIQHESEESDWPHDIPKPPESWNDKCIPPAHDDIWTSIEALFDLAWFRRVWIVQEFVIAHNVEIVCGEWTIDWSYLHQAVEAIDRQVQLYGFDATRLRSSWQPFLLLAAQREWEARKCRWALIMLLEHFRSTKSTLTRDHLFAMLGLACDGDEAEFEPDYESPLEQVLLRYARVFVRQGRGIQLLYRAGLNKQSHRFPSWIPDWTTTRPPGLYACLESGSDFAASGPQKAVIVNFPGSDELLVEGYTVDSIEKISVSTNEEPNLAIYFGEVDEMVDSALSNPVLESIEELKWKVPIAGALYPRATAPEDLDLRSSYKALRQSLEAKERENKIKGGKRRLRSSTRHPDMTGDETSVGSPNHGANYVTALHDALLGWKFVVTKQGYVGTVPKLTEAGDIVAIMKGGRVPFILRPSVTRFGSFRLVGECYVEGIMHGEVLLLPNVVKTTFRLH